MNKNKPKILNPDLKEDYHIHSINFSDGFNTIDEIVIFAGKLGKKKIMITDHTSIGRRKSLSSRNMLLSLWRNVHNDVEVDFGVEADILNSKGDIADTIYQNITDEKIILSPHLSHYQDDLSTLTEAFVNAIERFHERIFCIGHLHIGKIFWSPEIPESFDVVKVIETANKYKIPIEVNGSYLDEKCNCEILDKILEHAETIVINSDAHTLSQMKDNPEKARALLVEKGLLDQR